MRKKRRWLRRLLLVVLLLVVGLAILAALGPSIASMTPVRNLVLSQANQHLDGKIQVADWSFGWFGKQTISGIKVYDDKESLVAEVAKVTVDKSLLSAITDTFNFGRIRIERPNLNLRHHPDGSLNVARITRAEKEVRGHNESDGSAIEIPSVAGQVEIVDGIVTHSGAPGMPAVLLARINGNITMPGGDAPIQNKLDMIASVDDGAGGTVSVAGDLRIFKDGKLTIDARDIPDLSAVAGQQVLTYDGIDLAALRTLLGEAAPITSVKGKAAGTFTATITNGKEIAINGKTNVTGLAATGPVLKGDTLASETTEIVVPAILVALPNGLLDYQAARATVGASPEQPVTLTLQQGKATIFADVPVMAVLNVIDGKSPGHEGRAIIDANFDLGQLAAGLRNTFKLVEGVELTGGRLASRSVANISPAAIALASTTSIDGIAGRDARQGKPIALQPIKVDLAATAGGTANLLASVRDVKFDLRSAFANGSFAGPSLAGINGQLSGALDKLQAELGQVVDFGTVRMSGAFKVDASTQGDVTTASTTPVVLTAGLTASNVRVEGLADRAPIEQKQIAGKMVAEVTTDAATSLPKTVNITTATLRTGDAGTPTVSADATASIGINGDAIDVPAFAVKQFSLDLPRLANELGGLFPELNKASGAVSGTISATLAGSATGLATEPKITLASLDARHSGQLFNASVTEPLAVSLPAGAAVPQGSGRLQFQADLAQLNKLARALLPAPAQANGAAAGDVTSGRVAGTIALSRPDATHTVVLIEGDATNLSVTSATGPSRFEPIRFVLSANAADDLSTAVVDRATLTGPLVAADATMSIAKTGERIDATAFAVKQFDADLERISPVLAAFVPDLSDAASALTGKLSATLAGSASDLTASPSVVLHTLQAQQSQGMFKVSADGPFTVSLPKDAAIPQANGKLAVSANLAQLNTAVRKAFRKQLAIETASGDVKSGQIDGTLALSRPDATRTGVHADFVVANLAVATPGGFQNFQPIKLALRAAAADDLSSATIESASADGELLTARAVNTRVVLSDPANPEAPLDPLKLIEAADVSLAVPNLAPLYSIVSAFLPATKPAADGAPVVPLKVIGGSFSTKATVTRGANGLPTMNVSELLGEGLAVQKGESLYELASFAGTQTITPSGQSLSLKGSVPLKGLKLTEAGKVAFTEDQIDIGNDLLVDLSKNDAVINAVSFKMVSSGAVAVSARGAVRDYVNVRKFDNIVADVSYDLEPLWRLAKPFVASDPESFIANLTTSGKVERQITVGGQMPANLPFHEAIIQVVASGGVAVPVAELEGSKLENLEVAFQLADGRALLSMKPAAFNTGLLDFDGSVVDLADSLAPRLSMPAGKQLVQGATLNPFLATNVLGKFVNPAFVNPSKASGQLTVTVLRLERVPLEPEVIKSKGSENDGVAEVEFEVPELVLGNELLATILEATNNSPSINGAVRKSRVSLAQGVTRSDITIAAEQGGRHYPLRFAGAVSLSDMRLMPMNLSLLTEFLRGRGGDLAKYMPAEVTLPITGTTVAPRVQIDQLVGKLIEGAIQKQLTDPLLGAGQSDRPATGDAANPEKPAPEAEKPPETIEDAVGDLLKGLGKKKKK